MHFHHFYKKFKIGRIYSIFGLLILFGLFSNYTSSYYFGLKSANNTPENIQSIEQILNINLPIVSFIFDPWEENDVLNSIDRITNLLGTDRIYHFTISPNNFSAEDVVLGKFDAQYTAFFKKIKEKNLHVIFRTMHEMNGGRYPRSSNPEKFKAARTHVRTLSRLAGLDHENIAFDFSVNHWDMPTSGTPSQSATLIECSLGKKGCYHFEDYYPGDEYVDVVGFTFYNWGKAIGNRQWLNPTQILYDKNRKTYERLKALNKPIVIDEVATTSVRYDGNYSFEKSRSEYLNHNERKDLRLYQLWEFLVNHSEIIATLYFNTDYTYGLSFQITGEADWAIINLDNNKVYEGFQNLELFGEKDLTNIFEKIFGLQKININNDYVFLSKSCEQDFNKIKELIDNNAKSTDEKLNLIKTLQNKNLKSDCIAKSLNILYETLK